MSRKPVLIASLALCSAACATHQMPSPALQVQSVTDDAVSSITETPAKVSYSDVEGVFQADLVVGTGALASEGSTVSVHYSAWLADGTRFDSSVDRGRPLEVPLGRGVVIPGLERSIRGMRVGGVRQVEIPPELGYGDREIGPIPAGSTLTFQVALLEASAPRIPPEKPPEVSGWRTTASGLKIGDLGGCDAPSTPPGSLLRVDYTLWLMDGTRVDTSLARAEPLEIAVGKGMVIAGWDEGLRAAPVGCHRLLEVPPNLGYGDRRAGQIPPGSTLLFEVEVVGATPPAVAPPPPSSKKNKKGEQQDDSL